MAINYRTLERVVKGYANHNRLHIIDLLKREPELSVDEIAERLGIGYMNASDHIRKLAIAGLVMFETAYRHWQPEFVFPVVICGVGFACLAISIVFLGWFVIAANRHSAQELSPSAQESS